MDIVTYRARSYLIFLCVLLGLYAPHSYAQCDALTDEQMQQALTWSGKPVLGSTYKVSSWYVQDGDSLSLANGHRLRLGQINTTEMASKGRPEQAYAAQGKGFLRQVLQQHEAIYLQLLPEIKDHYGRWLVKTYDGAGLNAQGQLVNQGLAFVVSMDKQGVAPCLWQQEAAARRLGLGIWQDAISRVQDAARLTPSQGGFIRIRGRVSSISSSQHHWYIGLEGLTAIKIEKSLLARSHFNINDSTQLEQWLGQTISARGWLAWRKLSKKQRKKGYKAGVMSLYNLQMLEQPPS